MVIINLNRIENRPIFQCCNCKDYGAEITKVEIKKSRDYGENTLFFYIVCKKCGCPIYLHFPFKEIDENKIIFFNENSKVPLMDEQKGIPPIKLNFEVK